MSANHLKLSKTILKKIDHSTVVEWQRLFAAEKASDLWQFGEEWLVFSSGCQPSRPWLDLPTKSAVQDHTWV